MTSKVSHYLCVLLLGLSFLGDGGAAEIPDGAEDMVVVVSRASTVQILTRQQVEDIFLGRTMTFPNGQRVVPVDQAEGSDTRGRFYNEVLGRTTAQIRAHWSSLVFTGRGRPPRSVGSGQEVMQIVANDPQALGYIKRSLVTEAVRVVLE